ncbi:2-oxoacid:ferredoxin oxidoreductase subunit gamma [Candidatus Thorarchaeota archaeon]|nr:MAG: 2-oxoacid:ferredoxin oxidoreductase subunit gamma [Candidatus Thorarchaeota archaeon]
MRAEIRIAGTGGMGVVLAGVILGHAAVVYGGLDAVQSQSYGAEARGTSAKSEVIISDEPIKYPKVRQSDYFVAMSQKALDMYLKDARKGSVVLADPNLVNVEAINGYEVVKVPAMKIADDLGLRLVSNMVMLGALVQKSGVISLKVLENALAEILGSKALKVNTDAIHAGAKLV